MGKDLMHLKNMLVRGQNGQKRVRGGRLLGERSEWVRWGGAHL